MKYNVTFIAEIEGRDTITHGGVTFPVGKPVEVDSDLTEMSPWFEGNSSFKIEAQSDETSKIKPKSGNADAVVGAADASQGANQNGQKPAIEVKAPAKRVRKKAVAK